MPSKKRSLLAASGAGSDPLYVEDVFSTYLYDGVLSGQMYIQNGIDLSGEGGLIWIKSRGAVYDNFLFSTNLTSANHYLRSNTTGIEDSTSLSASYESDGFKLNSNNGMSYGGAGYGTPYVSWTFRKAEKFFDVVTYTGTGSQRTVSHNLGSVPRMMIIKKTNGTGGWWVYSKDWVDANSGSLGVALNLSNADAGLTGYDTDFFWGANPTDSVFSVGTYSGTNGNNDTFVAYLFASDAGGFGDDEDENIIKCGTYTGNGSYSSGPVIDLGFEPQWVLIKNATTAGYNWQLGDTMRGASTENAQYLTANTSNQEAAFSGGYTAFIPTATGFTMTVDDSNYNRNGDTYVYIAIRRPMKTPEAGTEVFAVDNGNGSDNSPGFISGFPIDMGIRKVTTGSSSYVTSRLTGLSYLRADTDAAKTASTSATTDYMNGWASFTPQADQYSWMFKRATGFMDVVAYTGNSAVSTVDNKSHNLGVVPELIIFKSHSGTDDWYVYHSAQGETKVLYLNTTVWSLSSAYMNNTAPTSSVFTANGGFLNSDGNTYIAYLFATLAGVSKVGSYTGTAADLNVDCGFTAGARFILIKHANSTGDWYTYDSLRGISAGNDPYLLMNSAAAEVTNTDYIDPLNAGFTVTSNASSTININGGTFIFLAIA